MTAVYQNASILFLVLFQICTRATDTVLTLGEKAVGNQPRDTQQRKTFITNLTTEQPE